MYMWKNAEEHMASRTVTLQFATDAEMAEILGDRKLLARLRRGSLQAKRGRGRFVA